MVEILQTTSSHTFSLNENILISYKISLECVSEALIDDKLIYVMAWHRTGDQPLHQSLMCKSLEAFPGVSELKSNNGSMNCFIINESQNFKKLLF